MGSYNSLDDLTAQHPTGNIGDGYLIDGDLYVWSENDNTWKDVGKVKGPQGIQGPAGPMGPTGPAGPALSRDAYIVKFNTLNNDIGIPVSSLARIPLDRIELDVSNIVNLNTSDKTIQFNIPGYYRISFTISAYPSVESVDFDPNKDIVSIGFRLVGTDNVYVGVGQWVYNGEAVELYAQGIISVTNTNEIYELVNLGKYTIYLNSPSIQNIASTSYFSNPLVTIVIDYLGRQNA